MLAAINPKDEHRCTPPVEVMVDTGAPSSWLPRQLLLDAGIKPVEKVQFEMADKRIIERDLGYAILTAEGYTTNDEVVFAEESDMNLLGVRTIEGFKVVVDNVGQRYIALSAVPCPANWPLTPPKKG
jgi:predicted aspartyl protease